MLHLKCYCICELHSFYVSMLLLLLFFTTKENSNPPGQKAKLNIESAKKLSRNMKNKIVDFGTHFEWILEPWADLGPPLDLGALLQVRCALQASIFRDLVSNWGRPKNTLGASRWPSELPRTSFGGNLLRTYFLHEIWVQKKPQKVVFFGPVDLAETL